MHGCQAPLWTCTPGWQVIPGIVCAWSMQRCLQGLVPTVLWHQDLFWWSSQESNRGMYLFSCGLGQLWNWKIQWSECTESPRLTAKWERESLPHASFLRQCQDAALQALMPQSQLLPGALSYFCVFLNIHWAEVLSDKTEVAVVIRKVWRNELSPNVLQLGFSGLENAVGMGASSAGGGRGAGDAGVMGDGRTGTRKGSKRELGGQAWEVTRENQGEQGTRCRGRGRHGSTLFRTDLMIDYWQNSADTSVSPLVEMLRQYRWLCTQPSLWWASTETLSQLPWCCLLNAGPLINNPVSVYIRLGTKAIHVISKCQTWHLSSLLVLFTISPSSAHEALLDDLDMKFQAHFLNMLQHTELILSSHVSFLGEGKIKIRRQK